jgi:hypothetical protein
VSARLPLLALGSFLVGAGLLFLFEHTLTRIVGIALLFAAIVGGVFAIATPELLEADESDDTDA